jgi:hypothetical protein
VCVEDTCKLNLRNSIQLIENGKPINPYSAHLKEEEEEETKKSKA